MKKIACLFFAAFFLFATCLVCTAASDEVTTFAGTYEGWYYANQGQTGLTLTVNEDGTGIFEFYNSGLIENILYISLNSYIFFKFLKTDFLMIIFK